MEPTILINSFEVPEGQDETFLARWGEAAEYMRRQDGFISTKLHASLNPQVRFRFVNVAEWRSPAHFQRAIGTEEFARISERMPYAHFPSVYQVIVG